MKLHNIPAPDTNPEANHTVLVTTGNDQEYCRLRAAVDLLRARTRLSEIYNGNKDDRASRRVRGVWAAMGKLTMSPTAVPPTQESRFVLTVDQCGVLADAAEAVSLEQAAEVNRTNAAIGVLHFAPEYWQQVSAKVAHATLSA